jgi:NAD(P)-dependent dehydrogenase (short-subunit alcohol dehydrogenase family)
MRSIAQLSDLTGRRAFVTGGAGNIARAVGETLVELGATVAVVDRDAAACAERAAELAQAGKGHAVAVACDLRSEVATRDAVRDTIARLGGLDIIAHLAAYVGTTPTAGWAVPFESQTVDAWEAAMRVNLTSAFVVVQAAREALMASGHGSVVFFSSTYGVVGPDNRLYEGTPLGNPAAYGVSKAGLLQLARYLATTLAPRVRVNCITPGGVSRNTPAPFEERYVARTPARRMASPEDVKGAVAFLCSDLSAYVTGHNLVVDGGWTAW